MITTSKRFIATLISMIIFTVMIYTTEYDPIELATGITMMLTVYIGVETYKPTSNVKKC